MSVRDHAQERLVAATTVTALVGARVYGRRDRMLTAVFVAAAVTALIRALL